MYEKYQLLTAECITLIIGLYFFIRCWFGFKKKPDMRIDEIPDEWVRNRCRNAEKMQKYFSLAGCVLGALLTLISLFYILHTCFFTIPQETKEMFNSGWITLTFFLSLFSAFFSFWYDFCGYNKRILFNYKENNFDELNFWEYTVKMAFISMESHWIQMQHITYGAIFLLYLSLSLFFISLLDIKSGYAYYLGISSFFF
ncbi:MAG: hypothetical protein J6M43_02925 [Neisseriaceae bacterium]|nr:hypothetical protein [Neisseriaceae bacterium]